MKILFLIISIFLLSSPSWSETLTFDDLVVRKSLYYKKFTNIPFTGDVFGKEIYKEIYGMKLGIIQSGRFKNGRRDGEWLEYYGDGELKVVKNYTDGKLDGLYQKYHLNGQLEMIGNYIIWYRINVRDGLWEYFNEDGSLKKTETWKDGERINCEGDC